MIKRDPDDDRRLRKEINAGTVHPDAALIRSGILNSEEIEELAWQENEARDLMGELSPLQRREWVQDGRPHDVASLRQFRSFTEERIKERQADRVQYYLLARQVRKEKAEANRIIATMPNWNRTQWTKAKCPLDIDSLRLFARLVRGDTKANQEILANFQPRRFG